MPRPYSPGGNSRDEKGTEAKNDTLRGGAAGCRIPQGRKSFPTIGKIFSNHWKNAENFFQSLENGRIIFPIVGKLAVGFAIVAFASLLCSCTTLKTIQFADDVEASFHLKRDGQYISSWLVITNWDARGDACRDFVLVNGRGAELSSKDFGSEDRVKTFCSAFSTQKRCPLHPESWLRDDGHCYFCGKQVDWTLEHHYQEQYAFWFFISNRLTRFEIRPAYPGNSDLKIVNPSTAETFPWPSYEADILSLFGEPITCTKRLIL